MDETKEQYEERAQAVIDTILESKDRMDCGKMLELLAGLGWDSALVYDDNGHWAMSDGGYASVSPEPSDWEGNYFVEAKSWKSTPRDAILVTVQKWLDERKG